MSTEPVFLADRSTKLFQETDAYKNIETHLIEPLYLGRYCVLELWMHEDAEEDLRQLRKSAPGAAFQIVALLEQLAADPDLLDRLTQEDYESVEDIRFNVDAVESLQALGLNIWRLKVWTSCDQVIFYRVIYGYDKKTNDYSVLGVVRRDTDYEPDHPRIQRIIAAYEDLDLSE